MPLARLKSGDTIPALSQIEDEASVERVVVFPALHLHDAGPGHMNRVERVEAADQGFRVVHGTPVPAGVERANTFLGLDRDAFEGAMTEDVVRHWFPWQYLRTKRFSVTRSRRAMRCASLSDMTMPSWCLQHAPQRLQWYFPISICT